MCEEALFDIELKSASSSDTKSIASSSGTKLQKLFEMHAN